MDYKEKVIALLNSQELSNEQKEKLKYIFPELKESEDERIRKDLCKAIWTYIPTEEGKEYIAWLEKQGEQKPVDKVEPKFKVGNWYQCIKDFFGKGITFDKNTAYYCAKEGCLQDEYGCHIAIVKDLYDNFKLWTIDDAKDGDVLVYGDNPDDKHVEIIMLFKSARNSYSAFTYFHIFDDAYRVDDWCDCGKNTHPATKEQRDLLFQKMKEASYEWDAEKKELKKIDNKEYNDEDYGIDGLFHAQIILENTLGKVAGYQSDDGILEHKCAISAVKKLYEQKFIEWSKEDEDMRDTIIRDLKRLGGDIVNIKPAYKAEIDWLKSLKDRVQPKQEWSEEDEEYLNFVIAAMKTLQVKCTENEIKQHSNSQAAPYYAKVINWLQRLRPVSDERKSE